MQPTFMPWLGYFYLIKNSERFIFLNDVQLEKTSWQRRNYVIDYKKKKEIWATIPISKKISFPKINEAKISTGRNFLKAINLIRNFYSKEKNFEIINHIIIKPLENVSMAKNESTSIKDLNIEIILRTINWLEINANIEKSENLNISNQDRIGRLIEINKNLGSNSYLSTPGSFNYFGNNVKDFMKAGIKLFILKIKNPHILKEQWMTNFLSLPSLISKFDKKDLINMLDSKDIFEIENIL